MYYLLIELKSPCFITELCTSRSHSCTVFATAHRQPSTLTSLSSENWINESGRGKGALVSPELLRVGYLHPPPREGSSMKGVLYTVSQQNKGGS